MRGATIVVLAFVALLIMPAATATSGRSAPECSELDLSQISSFVAVNPGACVVIDLGVRSSQQVLDIDIVVADDAMDVLLFNEATIQPYNLGQSYRTNFVPEASFESALGNFALDWNPPKGNEKRWYYVIDNLARDGDGGMGDQGGSASKFTLDVTVSDDSDWTELHNTFLLEADEKQNLLEFSLDASTGVTIISEVLSGTGDLFIQTDNQLSGDLFLSGTNMNSITTSSSLTWIVPENYGNYNLNLMSKASTSPFHFTIEVIFDPPITPVIRDYVNGSTVIGETIILDALDTPNSLNQIESFSWDFDGDGIEDENGMIVSASWSTPGQKMVNVTVVSPTGASLMETYMIEVLDIVNPTAVISGEGTRGLNGEWRLLRTAELVLRATTSFDDHGISSTAWSIDGLANSSASQITLSWSQIGTYLVELSVTDPSGNIGTVNTTVTVYDETIPMLETSAIDAITEVNIGEKTQFQAAAVDMWDEQENLRFTWDLDLETDSNNDGDPRNDPDATGSILTKTFNSKGTYQIALTVYDGSNNTDLHVFSVEVVEAPNQTGLFAIIAIVFFVIIVVAGVVLFGHKGMQRKLALQMLMDRGLSGTEAESRLLSIASSMKLSPFAKAAEMAGLESGGAIKSTEQLQLEAKAAEMAAIYGSDSGVQEDPYAGYKPATVRPSINPAIADEALAAFAEELPQKTQAAAAPVSGQVRSGGVVLPSSKVVTNEPPVAKVEHKLVTDCSSCGKPFSVIMPEGANSVVVACPSCGADQLFER